MRDTELLARSLVLTFVDRPGIGWRPRRALAVRNYAPAASPHVLVDTATDEDLTPPISPKTSPGPMSLTRASILVSSISRRWLAAQASLGAASSGQRALERMIIPRLIMKDLGVRRQQSLPGRDHRRGRLEPGRMGDAFTPVTRNFFTVQYIRSQQAVITDVLQSPGRTGYSKPKRFTTR